MWFFSYHNRNVDSMFLTSQECCVMTMGKRVAKHILELKIKAADGTAFYSCFRKPDGDGPFPAVLFIHGGYGDDPKYTSAMLDWSLADLLLQEGFVVFSTDYRVDHTGKDIGDIVAAFKFVADLPYVDDRKIAFFGDSHGAYLAIMAATQTRPSALIHGWGVADMTEWYGHIKGIPASYYQKVTSDLAKSLGGTPDQAPEAYRQVSPATHVANIKCPILILHGEEDKDVPVAHAHILARAIERAAGEFQLEIFKKAGHGLRSPEDRRKMDPLAFSFLNKHLKKS
jgi:dipeptidyl aminopeptidase/acylaminoacyl peptidase